MKPNKYEKFLVQSITRDQIHLADYNPRKISSAAFNKIKQKIRKEGLVQPIIVNRQTMNVVGGHQRLKALDEIIKKPDYPLSVAFIDVDEKKEVELNVFLNNPSAMGEWDVDMLVDLKAAFPVIVIVADMGFEKLDLDYIFSSAGIGEEITGIFTETEEQKDILSDIEKIQQSDRMRAAKKEYKEQQQVKNEEGESRYVEHDDYYVTFVFNNNSEKRDFMRKAKRPERERFVKATVLFDILKDEYKF